MLWGPRSPAQDGGCAGAPGGAAAEGMGLRARSREAELPRSADNATEEKGAPPRQWDSAPADSLEPLEAVSPFDGPFPGLQKTGVSSGWKGRGLRCEGTASHSRSAAGVLLSWHFGPFQARMVPTSGSVLKTCKLYPRPSHTALAHTAVSHFLGHLPLQNSTGAVNYTSQGSWKTLRGFSPVFLVNFYPAQSPFHKRKSLCGCGYDISP